MFSYYIFEFYQTFFCLHWYNLKSIYKIKGLYHVHNFESNMAANGHLINYSSVLENVGNVELDTPMNFYTNVHGDTSNSSLRRMEKYISEKYDKQL